MNLSQSFRCPSPVFYVLRQKDRMTHRIEKFRSAHSPSIFQEEAQKVFRLCARTARFKLSGVARSWDSVTNVGNQGPLRQRVQKIDAWHFWLSRSLRWPTLRASAKEDRHQTLPPCHAFSASGVLEILPYPWRSFRLVLSNLPSPLAVKPCPASAGDKPACLQTGGSRSVRLPSVGTALRILPRPRIGVSVFRICRPSVRQSTRRWPAPGHCPARRNGRARTCR